MIFKFLVDGQWKYSQEYPTSTDELGNVNNFLKEAEPVQGQTLQMKQLWTLPVIPEESPEIKKFQLPEVIVTDENGLEAVFTISKDDEKPRPGQVPTMVLTDVNGNDTVLPIVPNIVITDSDGNVKEEVEDLYQVPKAPAVHSFSDSSMHSEPIESELQVPEGDKEPIKTARKHKDLSKVPYTGSTSEETLHPPEGDKEPVKSSRKFRDDSKKPFKGLRKGASRLMKAVSLK